MKDKKSILVLGGGPAGMVAALGAIQKGYPVILATKYPYAAREQFVALDKATVKILAKFKDSKDPEDKQFFNKLNKSNKIIPIKAVEGYLTRKIKAAEKQNKITFLTDTTLEKLEMDNSNDKLTATLKVKDMSGKNEDKQVNVNLIHVIDATGSAGRVAFKKLHSNNPNSIEKHFDTLAHSAQGTTIFRVAKGASLEKLEKTPMVPYHRTFFTPSFSPTDIAELKAKFNWDKDYAPIVYILCNAQRTQFYVGGEIPSSILNIKNEKEKNEKVAEWSKYMLVWRSGMKPADLSVKNHSDEEKTKLREKYSKKGLSIADTNRAIESRAKMSITSFDMRLSRLKNPVQDLSKKPGKHVLVAVGDAFQSPHFHQGHGCKDAIKSSKKFIDCLPSVRGKFYKSFNFKRFKAFAINLRATHFSRLNKIKSEYNKKSIKVKNLMHVGKFSQSNKNIPGDIQPDNKPARSKSANLTTNPFK